MVMDQRVHLGHRPRRCRDRIASELSQRRDAQVAVDEHVARGLGDHDHGHLLALRGQRGQQAAAASRVVDTQVGVTQLELMELQVHAPSVLNKVASAPSRLARGGRYVWRFSV